MTQEHKKMIDALISEAERLDELIKITFDQIHSEKAHEFKFNNTVKLTKARVHVGYATNSLKLIK